MLILYQRILSEHQQLEKQINKQKYLSLLLDDLTAEQRALKAYLNLHPVTNKSQQFLEEPSEYLNLLLPVFTPKSQELSQWMTSEYDRNPLYPEQLIHKSISGNRVRSKSESLIDTLLSINKIPFRYECLLMLGDVTLYPDFTIRHPQSGQVYYWEHFGLMDHPNYAKNACTKLDVYTSNGIIPSIHLITTYETRDTPLSAETVEKIISHYFL